jgi:hypothetical protein
MNPQNTNVANPTGVRVTGDCSYPQTRWQVMAATGETVNETLDLHTAISDMFDPIQNEYLRLMATDPDRIIDIWGPGTRPGIARIYLAATVRDVVRLLDDRRHRPMVAHLADEADRDRAMELLGAVDAGDLSECLVTPWVLFETSNPFRPKLSPLPEQLRRGLAEDGDLRQAVTALLIRADTAARELLVETEGLLRDQGLEPERQRLSREAREQVARDELVALGINLDGAAEEQPVHPGGPGDQVPTTTPTNKTRRCQPEL